ncbi:hypothetical protein H4V97_002376 [Flavobacterium sp. CG_23.5]|nr:hypothetical protein [Flavobacterium sp. CG_9.10]MBP2284058.1 hypothetical protein [Flavobacterium sp. CG_23.5]
MLTILQWKCVIYEYFTKLNILRKDHNQAELS